jgi:hypothetical protein
MAWFSCAHGGADARRCLARGSRAAITLLHYLLPALDIVEHTRRRTTRVAAITVDGRTRRAHGAALGGGALIISAYRGACAALAAYCAAPPAWLLPRSENAASAWLQSERRITSNERISIAARWRAGGWRLSCMLGGVAGGGHRARVRGNVTLPHGIGVVRVCRQLAAYRVAGMAVSAYWRAAHLPSGKNR